MSKLKSILILGPAHPFRGGLSGFNHTLARTFRAMGLACRLFTFTTQYPRLLFPGTSQLTDEPAPEDLTISRELSSINPWTWWRTGRRVKRLRPDLLIVRYWIPAMAPAFGTVARMARWAGVRTIALLDNVIPHEKRPMDSWLTRYFIGSMDGFIYMSEQVHRDLRQFTADKPAVFSPHPMFTQYGEPLPREEACKRLGLDPGLHYTLFFGYIRDYKGLDLLYEAWAVLKKAGWLKNHRLVVAGEYYSGRERYERLLRELDIQDEVLLFDRFIAEGEVRLFFSAADLVCQPYRTATQSGVTQVAYWFDVPMVVTDVGGLREIVPDGQVGYVTAPEPEAIAAAIRRFYDEHRSEEFRSQILHYRERFTWEGMARNFVDLYDRLAEKPQG